MTQPSFEDTIDTDMKEAEQFQAELAKIANDIADILRLVERSDVSTKITILAGIRLFAGRMVNAGNSIEELTERVERIRQIKDNAVKRGVK